MKKLFLILFLFLSCGRTYHPGDYLEITKINSYGEDECYFTVSLFDKGNQRFDSDFKIKDKCDKYKIGDEIYITKRKRERIKK